MKPLKEQIRAIKVVIKNRERTEFTTDGNKKDQVEHLRVENSVTSTLRDAATTLIALNLLTKDREKFLTDFATKLDYWPINATRSLEEFLVEKGLLPAVEATRGKQSSNIAETIRQMKGPYRPGEIGEFKLISTETLKPPSFKRWAKQFPGATLQDYEEVFEINVKLSKRKPRGKN